MSHDPNSRNQISQEELLKLANLARLNIEEDAQAEVAARISNVLNLVDELQAVQTDGIKPMAHPLDVHQTLRQDQVIEDNQREALLALAPQTERGLFLVPKVIE